MNKKMIVVDLDGTLLNIDSKVTSKTKKYLLDLKNKGYIIVIATGRILDSAIAITEGADFANYIIGNAGGMIYDKDNDKVIFKNVIDKTTVKNICSLYNEDINYMDICDSHYYYIYTDKNYSDHGFSKVKRNVDELVNNIEVIHMSIIPNNNIDNIFNQLNGKFKNIRSYIMNDSFNHNNRWIEIAGENINKFNAIKMVSQIENLDTKDIITFGDSINDIEMIQGAGVGVAMGNAIDKVKQVANYITDSHNEDGIVSFLETFLFNEKRF